MGTHADAAAGRAEAEDRRLQRGAAERERKGRGDREREDRERVRRERELAELRAHAGREGEPDVFRVRRAHGGAADPGEPGADPAEGGERQEGQGLEQEAAFQRRHPGDHPGRQHPEAGPARRRANRREQHEADDALRQDGHDRRAERRADGLFAPCTGHGDQGEKGVAGDAGQPDERQPPAPGRQERGGG